MRTQKGRERSGGSGIRSREGCLPPRDYSLGDGTIPLNSTSKAAALRIEEKEAWPGHRQRSLTSSSLSLSDSDSGVLMSLHTPRSFQTGTSAQIHFLLFDVSRKQEATHGRPLPSNTPGAISSSLFFPPCLTVHLSFGTGSYSKGSLLLVGSSDARSE